MSSTTHLTAIQTDETKINKRHSSFNLRTTPTESSIDFLYTLSPTNNFNYLHSLNADTIRKPSITITQDLTPTSSIKGSSLNIRRKLSAISLPVPWSKRKRSTSIDKTSPDSISKHSNHRQQKSHKMSRDHLLTIDRLFSSGTHMSTTANDDEQASPITEFTVLGDSLRSNEKSMKPTKENGYLHNSHLMTR
jgi:hypothetical protein